MKKKAFLIFVFLICFAMIIESTKKGKKMEEEGEDRGKGKKIVQIPVTKLLTKEQKGHWQAQIAEIAKNMAEEYGGAKGVKIGGGPTPNYYNIANIGRQQQMASHQNHRPSQLQQYNGPTSLIPGNGNFNARQIAVPSEGHAAEEAQQSEPSESQYSTSEEENKEFGSDNEEGESSSSQVGKVFMNLKIDTTKCAECDGWRRTYIGTHGAEFPLGLAKLREATGQWEWRESHVERTWSNGNVAAFELPPAWLKEMGRQSGEATKFTGGNKFRLKIIRLENERLEDCRPEIVSEEFDFRDAEEIIVLVLEQTNWEDSPVIGRIGRTNLMEMNGHLLTGRPLIGRPHHALVPVPDGFREEVLRPSQRDMAIINAMHGAIGGPIRRGASHRASANHANFVRRQQMMAQNQNRPSRFHPERPLVQNQKQVPIMWQMPGNHPNPRQTEGESSRSYGRVFMKIKIDTTKCAECDNNWRRPHIGEHGAEFPLGLAKLRAATGQWEWRESHVERTWSNGNVAAFELPPAWLKEMGWQPGEGGNRFRLKIIGNANHPEIMSEEFDFRDAEEIIVLVLEQTNWEDSPVIGRIERTNLMEMNGHLLTGRPLIGRPHHALMPAPDGYQGEVLRPSQMDLDEINLDFVDYDGMPMMSPIMEESPEMEEEMEIGAQQGHYYGNDQQQQGNAAAGQSGAPPPVSSSFQIAPPLPPPRGNNEEEGEKKDTKKMDAFLKSLFD